MFDFIEKIQEKQNKKFQDDLRNSKIIKTETIPVKKLHLTSNAKRIRSLIFLLINLVYSIITKIVLGELSFDLIVVLNIILVATDAYLRINGNSMWELQYYSSVNAVRLINSLVSVFLFAWTLSLYTAQVNEYFLMHEDVLYEIMVYQESDFVCKLLYFLVLTGMYPLFFVPFIYSIIAIVPMIFYLIKQYVIYVKKTWIRIIFPPYEIVYFIRWLVSFKDFKEYVIVDDKNCEVRHRRLNNSGKVVGKIVARLLLVGILLVGYVAFILSI